MEGDTANVTQGHRPRVTLLPRRDIGHIARHARSPFIISHRKSLMGNYLKELSTFINMSKFSTSSILTQ